MPSPPLETLSAVQPTIEEIVQRGESIAFVTGSGVSQESGLATFRGADGLWRNHDAMRLATPQAFAEDPHAVWKWYGERRHRALALAVRG